MFDPLLVYHYTVEPSLEKIFRTGHIRQATEGIDPGEKPAVWCTTSDSWDNTATKAVWLSDGNRRHLTKEEMLSRFGMARIAIDATVVPYTWDEYKRMSGVSNKTVNYMKRMAYERGCKLSNWRVSFEPICSDRWRAIERWDGISWTSAISGDALIPWSPKA